MLRDHDSTMRLGLVCLALANVLFFFLRPGRYPSELGDGVAGLLFGLAIGLLLLSAWRKGRAVRRSGEPPGTGPIT